jgi:hypothetical protein
LLKSREEIAIETRNFFREISSPQTAQTQLLIIFPPWQKKERSSRVIILLGRQRGEKKALFFSFAVYFEKIHFLQLSTAANRQKAMGFTIS